MPDRKKIDVEGTNKGMRYAALAASAGAALLAYGALAPHVPREAAFMAAIFVLAALLWVTEALPLFATALAVIGLALAGRHRRFVQRARGDAAEKSARHARVVHALDGRLGDLLLHPGARASRHARKRRRDVHQDDAACARGCFHLFEMPLIGYAGYLPFGVGCALVMDLVARIVAPRAAARV